MFIRLPRQFLILPALALVGLLSAQPASAEVDCDVLPEFITVDMPDGQEVTINQRHIFCGEVRDFRAVGFHAQPNGETPNTVIFDDQTRETTYQVLVQNQWVANGIYDLWDFLIAEDGEAQAAYPKYRSTMFPDHCSQEEVIDAIAYAALDQEGMSGPTCLTAQGVEFPVTVFWDDDGDNEDTAYVDTAYPYIP